MLQYFKSVSDYFGAFCIKGLNILILHRFLLICCILLSGCSPNIVLYGHAGHVTCLLYPHDENPRYDQTYLISGGSDFTVRAWNIMTGTLAHTFSCHGGKVLRLLVTPAECNVS